MNINFTDTARFSTLKKRLAFNLIMPVFIISLLKFGWFAVDKQVSTLKMATISAYQKAELEIVRVAARSITLYIEEQVKFHHVNDVDRIEQNIFKLFIHPIKLLKSGDAWIYAPDHVVFDLSEDFPDEYKGKSMAQIFNIQQTMGADHFEEMTAAVMNAQEGVGWYVWLPDKGREIAAWTPVKVGEYTWSIGMSVPLPEILEYTGSGKQIATIKITMSIATIAALIVLTAWWYGVWIKEQIAQDLQESRRMLQTILDNMPQFLFWKNKEGIFLGCNKNFARVAGVGAAENILGKTDYDLAWKKEEADFFVSCDKKVMERNAPELHIIEPQLQADGKQAWLDTCKIPLVDDNNKVFGLLGMYEDVTERKQGEEELKRAKNYIANIIESMPSALVGVDINNKITQWNSKAEHLTGVSRKTALGKPLISVFPQMDNKLDTIVEAIKTKEIKKYRKEAHQLNDRLLYEDITIYPLIADGVEGAVIIIEDVTDKVYMEEMVVQSEKMMSVGGLAAGMAHEINNPLAGMIQTANVIKSRLENIDLPVNQSVAEELGISIHDIKKFMKKRDISRMLDTIQDAGSQAAEIVNSMLSFARKSDADMSSHYPDQLMDDILELATADYDLKKNYDFKSVEIVKEYSDNMPELFCDRGKIQQVLLNVLRNSAQAMKTAETKCPKLILRIYSEKAPPMVRIEIEDNGPGMDENTMSKVFDPFFTTKPVGIGTGLGLSVSYFIITENHKGKMTVESSPGAGAKFIISLPMSMDKHQT